MSVSKIPDSLLQKFRCSQCFRYLSMAPIGVGVNGQSICGRCTNLAAPHTVLIARCKLFEELASLHVFPCSYKSQGCLEYVYFNQATDHENKCAYRTYQCPANFHSDCNWEGPLLQIYQHYKHQHPELCLKTPYFRIHLSCDYEIHNLVKINGVVMLLQTKYVMVKKKIWFNAVYIGAARDELLVKFKVQLYGESSERTMEMEERNPLPASYMNMIPANSIEVDVDDLLALLRHPEFINCHWYITSQLELSPMPQTQSTFKCFNCLTAVIPPIYRCRLAHIICVDCKGYNNSCGICHETNVEFSRAIDLENDAYSKQFSCKWKNCQKIFAYDKIREHELGCLERIYTCPECDQRIGQFNKILQHFRIAHGNVPFEVIQSDTLNFPTKIPFMYVVAHREIFKVNLVKDAESMWDIHIMFYGPPSLDSYFRYEVRDHYNVLYYVSKCYRNHYKALQLTYCTNNVRSEYYLTIKFKKQTAPNAWIPFDSAPQRACMH